MTPQDHVQAIGTHLSAGRYDLIAGTCAFPLPVYINGAPSVLGSAQDFWTLLQSLHAFLRAGGHGRIEARLTAVEVPRNARFRLWADWVSLPEETLLFRSICYNQGTHESHETHMLRIESVAWPHLGRMLAAA